MYNNSTLEIIAQCAEIPSFTTYEERLFPHINRFVKGIPGVEIILLPENNMILSKAGNPNKPPVALSAHLDKINHFGQGWIDPLPVSISEDKIIGQLDDAIGVGLCLSVLQQADDHDFPPLLILFTELEESYGLKHHPERLHNTGQGVHSGLGAERISDYLLKNNLLPELVITIDTTPLFKGQPGLAIYTDHWEKNGLVPSRELITRTEEIRRQFLKIDPGLQKHNNTNDYLTFGLKLNGDPAKPVPCIALEPAIYPYHQQHEEVLLGDIERLEKCLVKYLRVV